MRKIERIGLIATFIFFFTIIFMNISPLDANGLSSKVNITKIDTKKSLVSKELKGYINGNIASKDILTLRNESKGILDLEVFGQYETISKTQILNELNRIRREACNENINGLTPSDYVPLKWSVDLENITSIRAVEASVKMSHTRPNNQLCFTCLSMNNQQSYGENLAWNFSQNLTMTGISQYYSEKADLLNNTGNQTGHYEAIINKEYKTVAASGFFGDKDLMQQQWGCTAMEFSYNDLPDGDMDLSQYSSCVIPVAEGYLNEVKELYAESPITVGDKGFLGVLGLFHFPEEPGVVFAENNLVGIMNNCVHWSSSNNEIASITNDNPAQDYEVLGFKPGKINVTASLGSYSDSKEVEVIGKIIEEPTGDTPEGYVRVKIDFGTLGTITGLKTFDVREGESWYSLKEHIPGFDLLQGIEGYMLEGFSPSLPQDSDKITKSVTYVASYKKYPRIIEDATFDVPNNYFTIKFNIGTFGTSEGALKLYVKNDVIWSELEEYVPKVQGDSAHNFIGFNPALPDDSVDMRDETFNAEYELRDIMKDPNIAKPDGYVKVKFTADSPLTIEEGREFFVKDGITWATFKEYIPTIKPKFDYVFSNFFPSIPEDSELVTTGIFSAEAKKLNYLRYNGTDRLSTAVEISKGFKDTSDNVVVAVATSFPDALSGAPLAKKLDAPILLTLGDSLSPETAAEIKRLKAKNVYILGGIGVISKNVENQLNNIVMNVQRVGGIDRIETSYQIANMVLEGQDDARVFVANALDFPDALAAGCIAAAKGSPIFLTLSNEIDEVGKEILKRDNVKSISVNGGVGAVSENLYVMLKSFGKPISRNEGGDRIGTAIEIAKNESPDSNYLYIATALNFPDALTGSVLASTNDGVILLTLPNAMPAELKDYLNVKKSEIPKLYFRVFGGIGSVDNNVEKILKQLAE